MANFPLFCHFRACSFGLLSTTFEKNKSGAGFTTLELLVSISIFVFMTTLLFVESNQFDRGIILTNAAYGVATHVRTAQNYGLSVKKAGDSFDAGYGVHFDTASGENTKATLFAFLGGNEAVFSPVAISGSEIVYALKNGIYVETLCAGTEINCVSKSTLDVLFKRPDLDAILCPEGLCLMLSSPYVYARITLSLPDGDKRYVIVTKTGLISVKDTP